MKKQAQKLKFKFVFYFVPVNKQTDKSCTLLVLANNEEQARQKLENVYAYKFVKDTHVIHKVYKYERKQSA